MYYKMPKDIVDYSQTIIYKIFCKNELIEDIYIGHTTNFTKRKYQHKISCNNGNKLKIYEIIRNNGGWDNWDMIEIAKYNCKDATEARIKEQEHYNELKASLNVKPPYIDKKQYYCFACNIQCQSPNQYYTHINSNKHKDMIYSQSETSETDLSLKVAKNHHCELCDYNTFKFTDYKKHLHTLKHKNRENETLVTDLSLKVAKNLQCICGMSFNNRTTLWRHKKICNGLNASTNIITTDLVMELINDNKEMKQIILEQNNTISNLVKNGIVTNNNNNTTTHTNSHNKAFNLNFFLNETFKNAMNITDFVDSIKLQLNDLMEVGELGYVEGISKIIVKNLNDLDETERPIHCTDKKRETMYIKDQGEWSKEDEEKKKIKKVINTIANKNIKLLPQFREKFPEYNNSSSKVSDTYDKMVIEAMGGSDDNSEEKIIKNISKVTTIFNKSL